MAPNSKGRHWIHKCDLSPKDISSLLPLSPPLCPSILTRVAVFKTKNKIQSLDWLELDLIKWVIPTERHRPAGQQTVQTTLEMASLAPWCLYIYTVDRKEQSWGKRELPLSSGPGSTESVWRLWVVLNLV